MLTSAGMTGVVLYLLALMVATLAAWLITYLFSRPANDDPIDLDPFEIAYLLRGREDAVNTAVMSLWHRRLLSKDRHSRRLVKISKPVPDDLAPLEAEILEQMNESLDARSFRALYLPSLDGIQKRLEDEHLLLTGGQRAAIRVTRILPLGLLFFVGLLVVVTGMLGASGSMILMGLMALTLFVMFLFLFVVPNRTARGTRVLRHLARANAALQYASHRRREDTSVSDVAAGAALFGLAAVPSGPELESSLQAPEPTPWHHGGMPYDGSPERGATTQPHSHHDSGHGGHAGHNCSSHSGHSDSGHGSASCSSSSSSSCSSGGASSCSSGSGSSCGGGGSSCGGGGG